MELLAPKITSKKISYESEKACYKEVMTPGDQNAFGEGIQREGLGQVYSFGMHVIRQDESARPNLKIVGDWDGDGYGNMNGAGHGMSLYIIPLNTRSLLLNPFRIALYKESPYHSINVLGPFLVNLQP